VLLSSFVATSLLNYVFVLSAGWILSAGDFGVLAAAQAIVLVCGVVLEAGFPWALARSLANDSRLGLVRESVLLSTLAANLVFGTLMSATILGLFALGPFVSVLESVENAVLVAIALPFIAVATTARGAAQGRGRFRSVALIQIVEMCTKSASSIALMIVGFGLSGALAGFTLGAAAACALGVRQLAFALNGSHGFGMLMPALRAAAPILGALLGIVLMMNADLIVLKLVSGTERELVGLYQGARVLSSAPFFLVSAAILPVLFTELARLGERAERRRALLQGLRLAAVVVVPSELGLALFPEFFLNLLFPDEYAASAGILRLLASGGLFLTFAAVLSCGLQATGRAAVAAFALLGASAIEIGSLVATVPTWRAEGAAASLVSCALLALLALGVLTFGRPGETITNTYGSRSGTRAAVLRAS
jgi:O-antigen/teichoic acid export membrane protein